MAAWRRVRHRSPSRPGRDGRVVSGRVKILGGPQSAGQPARRSRLLQMLVVTGEEFKSLSSCYLLIIYNRNWILVKSLL